MIEFDRHPGDDTMDFPPTDLTDQDACCRDLAKWLHPDGLAWGPLAKAIARTGRATSR